VEPGEPVAPEPPADPEAWTDEEWLVWLKATDVEVAGPGAGDQPPAVKPRRAGAQVLGEAMVGMARAIYGQQHDEIVIVAEGASEPESDEPFTVHLDPDHPERSHVVFRADPPPPD
jgi:hypothetical protein